MVEYESIVYDLSTFGVGVVNNIIVNSDKDDGVTLKVSFDGGASYMQIDEFNTKLPTNKPNPRVKVKIVFANSNQNGIYTIKASGFLQNYGVGTEVTFKKTSTGTEYKTSLGSSGRYQINLPRGMYDVSVIKNDGTKETVLFGFDPETSIDIPTHRLDKENSVEQFVRDVEWVRFCLFDTFDDKNKIARGSSYVDVDGDLCNFDANTKCRYWAIGFD